MARFKVKKLRVVAKSTTRVKVKAKPSRALDKAFKPKPAPVVEQIDKKLAARQRYRNEHNVVMESCADNLAQLPNLAKMHTVTFPNGAVRSVPAFTITAMGEPFGTTGVTVTRWVKAGMIPEAVLTTSRGKVFHIEEARAMVRIIGEHQRNFRQYRAEHTDIRDKVFREVRKVREGLYQAK